jgi:tetratricopeptide (TPR) repeat protein
MEDWATLLIHVPKRLALLLEVARRADPDPWRDRFRDPKVWRDRGSLEALAKELLADERQLGQQKHQLLYALGFALHLAKADPLPLLRASQARYPDDFWLNSLLAEELDEAKKWDEAIGFRRACIAVRPSVSVMHLNLGYALYKKKHPEEAIQEYRRAIVLDPFYAMPHHNLGVSLAEKKQLDEAIREFRRAIALDAKFAPTYHGLGDALGRKKLPDAAIVEYRKAIALDPRYASPHIGLGNALRDKQHLDEAIQEYRRAIALDPESAVPHVGLGNALHDKKQLEAAILEYRKAIELDHTSAESHNGLGVALLDKRHLDGAIKEIRIAIALDPTDAIKHYNLGLALHQRQQLEEAIQEYRRAIALDPKHAQAHCNLGGALRQRGLLVESLAEYQEGHRLSAALPHWQYPSAQWVQKAEGLVLLERKLVAILEGKDKPANDAERLDLAQLCQQPDKQLYSAAYRFFVEAFAHDPRLAEDMQQEHRYNAACAAALAGCGQGKDADRLNAKERARLRQQAVAWLSADLKHWTKQASSDKPGDRVPVREVLNHWQDDPDLAGLRESTALKKLPADERAACQKLWDDVADLLKKIPEMAK